MFGKDSSSTSGTSSSYSSSCSYSSSNRIECSESSHMLLLGASPLGPSRATEHVTAKVLLKCYNRDFSSASAGAAQQ